MAPAVSLVDGTQNLTTGRGRALNPLSHEFHHTGTFCMGGKLAPLIFMLGGQRCGTQSLYDGLMEHVKGARYGHPLSGEPEHVRA
jgi:hypothetical protein